MKNKLVLLLSIITLSISAQKYLENPKYGATKEDRQKCVTNQSIYSEYVKQKNLKDAIKSWKIVYDICPKASKNIYIHGAKIHKYLISQEKDQDKKREIVDQLLGMYDKRIEHFGKEGYVLGLKGGDAYNMKKDDLTIAYKTLKKSLELQLGKSKSSPVLYFMMATTDLFKQNKVTKTEVIEAFQLCNKVADLAIPKQKSKKLKNQFITKKAQVERLFVASGAASCDDLKLAFEPKLKDSKDVELHRNVMKTLESAGCNYEPFYNHLVEKTYKIDPSANEAVALAKKFQTDSEFDKAVTYFEEAINLEKDDVKKSDYNQKIAMIKVKNEDFNSARKYINEAIKLDKNNAQAYNLLGDIYARKSKEYKDAFEKATVFWVVVDKFKLAKKADPSMATTLNKKINSYSKYFPSQNDIFFRTLKIGASYKVGGWINETTTIRKSK
jgi:tetratricopeptide (TPR) repeat protein